MVERGELPGDVVLTVPPRPIWVVAPARADSRVTGSNTFMKSG
jgi:hypothetical protein